MEEESRSQWNKTNEDFKNELVGGNEEAVDNNEETAAPSVDFE